MRRREFLKSVPPVALIPQLRAAPRLKITDIRIVNLKVVRETGKMEAAWNPGTVTTHRIGGGSVIEIRTDQGLSGIGPAIDASALEPAKARLAGMDPFILLNSADREEIGLMQVLAVRTIELHMKMINEDLANRIVNKISKLFGSR